MEKSIICCFRLQCESNTKDLTVSSFRQNLPKVFFQTYQRKLQELTVILFPILLWQYSMYYILQGRNHIRTYLCNFKHACGLYDSFMYIYGFSRYVFLKTFILKNKRFAIHVIFSWQKNPIKQVLNTLGKRIRGQLDVQTSRPLFSFYELKGPMEIK